MRPMYDMSHAIAPSPREFSLLPIHKMRLQDGSIKDGEIKQLHVVYIKLRAFFMSYAWVNITNLTFFTCDAAETMTDKLLTLLHAHHANGRPPIKYYLEAWDQTARVFQVGVRSGKSLTSLCEADTTWTHFWNNWVPDASRGRELALTEDDREPAAKRAKGTGKAKNQNTAGNQVAAVQQAKDRQIADLRKQLADARAQLGSGSGGAGGSGGGGGAASRGWKSGGGGGGGGWQQHRRR